MQPCTRSQDSLIVDTKKDQCIQRRSKAVFFAPQWGENREPLSEGDRPHGRHTRDELMLISFSRRLLPVIPGRTRTESGLRQGPRDLTTAEIVRDGEGKGWRVSDGEDETPESYEDVFEALNIPEGAMNRHRKVVNDVPFQNCRHLHNVSIHLTICLFCLPSSLAEEEKWVTLLGWRPFWSHRHICVSSLPVLIKDH